MIFQAAQLAPVWRLRERMKIAEIHSASELHRRLRKTDPGSIHFAQLATLIDKPPARLTLRTITALAIVLKCQIGDILGVDPANFEERT